ncbi:hypothetical protein LTR15_011162 [Elasticomyces elasticus]|nr:hypothetical protein LTR15_011162 [Elasticomyces elasticus]
MNDLCDDRHSNDRSAGGLLVLHCEQYADPHRFASPRYCKGFEWLRTKLEPFARHPLGASAGHANHGEEMTLGINNSTYDLDIARCNTNWEPWPWNAMRGPHDEQNDDMVVRLRDAPRGSPDNWSADRVPVPDVPQTQFKGRRVVVESRRALTQRLMSPSPPNPTGPPAVQNLSNTRNICYASATIQVIYSVKALKAAFMKVSSLPFRVGTGRAASYLAVQRDDEDFAQHKILLRSLHSTLRSLDTAMKSLPAEHTLTVVRSLNTLRYNFPIGIEQEPAEFLDAIVEVVDCAGDASRDLAGRPSLQNKIDNDHALAVLGSRIIPPLKDDYQRAWDGYLQSGHNSAISKLLTIQVAQESLCRTEDCPARYTRTILHHKTINLVFPRDASSNPGRTYTVGELLSHNDQVATDLAHAAIDCQVTVHPPKTEVFRRVLRLPPVLIMRVERQSLPGSLRGYKSQAEMEREADKNRIRNRLVMQDTLDMSPWCSERLPSEHPQDFDDEPVQHDYGDRSLEDPCGPRKHYRLMATMSWRGYHIVTHARIKDDDGYMRWVLLDDTKDEPAWQSPFEDESSLEVTLIYVKLNKAEQTALAAITSGVPVALDASADDEDELLDDEDDPNAEVNELEDDENESDDDDSSDSDEEEEGVDYSELSMIALGRRLHKELSAMAHIFDDDESTDRVLAIAGQVLRLAEAHRDLSARVAAMEDNLKKLVANAGPAPASVELESKGLELQALESRIAEANATLQNVEDNIRKLSETQSSIGGLVQDSNALLNATRTELNTAQQDQAAAERAVEEAEITLNEIRGEVTGAQNELELIRANIEQQQAQGTNVTPLSQLVALLPNIAQLLPQLSDADLAHVFGIASTEIQQRFATQRSLPAPPSVPAAPPGRAPPAPGSGYPPPPGPNRSHFANPTQASKNRSAPYPATKGARKGDGQPK